MKHLIFTIFAGLLLAIALPAASGPPAEADIKKSIDKAFSETYVDPKIWKVTRIACEFGPVKIGKQVLKQVQWGKAAEPVWPVKVLVKVTEFRGDQVYKVVTRGVTSDDVFFFYRDAFDDWRFKTGSL